MAHIPAVTFDRLRCRIAIMNRLMTASKEAVISCSFVGSAEQIIGAYAVKVGKLYERVAWDIYHSAFVAGIGSLAHMENFRKLPLFQIIIFTKIAQSSVHCHHPR